MSKVLVTGADGFIGSHLVENLISSGHEVKALCQYNSLGTWGWLDHLSQEISQEVEIISGDIRAPYLIDEITKGCSSVFHLAALIAIPYSYNAPHEYIQTNVIGTCNVLQAALKNKVKNFIHTSTSEVYGTAQFVPITEEHPLSGQSPYAASKIGADQLAFSYYTSFGLPLTVVRPFNTYGPRQSARAVIPSVIIQLLEGPDVHLGKISPTRDFNYVLDTVSGFIASLNSEAAMGEVINLGSNFEISIKETALLISEVMGKEINIIEDDLRLRPKKSEVDRLFASNEKAKKLLKWKPKYSGLEGFKKGLEETCKWFSLKENRSLYKSSLYNI